MQVLLIVLLSGAALLHQTASQPFQPGQNLIPLGKLCGSCKLRGNATQLTSCNTHLFFKYAAGNLLTSDAGGPYNTSLLTIQANEIRGDDAKRCMPPTCPL